MTRGLAALLLATVLAACGGGGGSNGNGTPATPPSPPTTPVTPVTPPPKYPIPTGLWSAPPGAAPATGNYVYLQSDSGDYIGAGRTYLYRSSNAVVTITGSGLAVDVNVSGNESWNGSFRLPSGAETLQAGYFQNLTRAPFADPAVGGIDWFGEGRGCNTIKGWLVIDRVELTAGAVTAIDLRFEQHCEGGTAALRGELHWSAGDTTGAPGPENPPPAGLWKPDASFVPPAGNYVYLVSDNGDYIGAGRTQLLTPANSTLNVTTDLTNALSIAVGGWSGNFVGMNSQSQLKPGYYGNLQRYPFHNAVRGGLDWSGNGRGCNTLAGWFVVDKVSYALGQLTAIDLRFEQHCEGDIAAQRGVIHWAK
jgi:hypothetical protein